MHAVQCPNCTKTLRLKKPVQNARMRCRHCGEVFVGTSQEAPDPVQAAPAAPKPLQTPPPLHAAPAAAPDALVDAQGLLQNAPLPSGPPAGGYAPPRAAPGPRGPYDEEQPRYRRRRPSVVPLVICCVALPLIIAVAIYAVWNYNNPVLIEKDSHGNVLSEGRVPRARFERIIEERKKAEERGPDYVPPPQDTLSPGGGPSGLSPSPPADPVTPERSPPEAGPGETPGASPFPAAAIPDGDKYVLVNVDNQPITLDETPTTGFFVGDIQNKYTAPLTSVSILLYTHDEAGRARPPIPGQLAFIPAQTTIPFSMPYQGLTVKDIGKVIARVTNVRGAAKNAVSWVVPEDRIRMTREGNEIVLAVTLTNPTGAAARNVKVYYDFFDQQGVQVSFGKTRSAQSAPGSLAAGAEATFTLRYRPSIDESSVNLIRNWYLRVWAEK